MSRKETINRLAQSLLSRRNELLSKINQAVTASFESQVGESDSVSEALGSKFHLAESDVQELERISKALLRYQKNELGICKACRKNIPLVRLRAIPHAVRCVPYQEKSESCELDYGSTDDHVVLDTTSFPEVLSVSSQLS